MPQINCFIFFCMFLCWLHWCWDSTLRNIVQNVCVSPPFPPLFPSKDVLIVQEETGILFSNSSQNATCTLTASSVSGRSLSWEAGHYQPFMPT